MEKAHETPAQSTIIPLFALNPKSLAFKTVKYGIGAYLHRSMEQILAETSELHASITKLPEALVPF